METSRDIIIATTDSLEGFTIKKYLGVASGQVAGHITLVNELHEAAREQLLEHASQLGATAVVGLRYEVLSGGDPLLVCCYGTAVAAEAQPGTPMT